jgi:superfamily II DNA helicase RecQ
LACDKEVQLEIALTDKPDVVQTCAISAFQVIRAQRIIAGAKKADNIKQNKAIDKAIQLLYPYPPREGQRNALHQLIYKGKDLILIAKTSFGKSMILQAVSILTCRLITLVVLPLDCIGQEQAEYITRIGGRPCLLNAKTISRKILADIQQEKYTHILISPELAIGDKFHDTATHPGFKQRLGLVVVDEAHLVSQWGREFRTEYARLGQLRSLLGAHVPWFACSATLDAGTLEEVKRGLGFEEDVMIMRTSIDRPELVIRLGVIPKNKRKIGTALRYLFDEGAREDTKPIPTPQNIPKTIVFFDSKNEAYAVMHESWNWLQDKHGYSEELAKQTIKIFHRDTATFDKEIIIAEFQRLGGDSSIRVIFATEALGMGVNLPDVRRAVQYGLPKGEAPAILLQRGGRACRDGLDGEIILLVDEWVRGPLITAPPSQKGHQSNHKLRKNPQPQKEAGLVVDQQKKTLTERRSKLPHFWYMFANDPSCLRARILEFFDEPEEYRVSIRKDRCCSNCNPDLDLGKLDNHYLYKEHGNRLDTKRKKVLELIATWGESQLSAIFPNALFQPTVYCFITEDQLTKLAREAHLITNLNELHIALGIWPFFKSHGTELLKQLRAAYYATEGIPPSPKKAASQTQALSQQSWDDNSWNPVTTMEIMSQATLLQSTAPPSPPPSPTAPDLSDLQAPSGPTSPDRQLLDGLSGNRPSAKPKRSNRRRIAPEKLTEPVSQELPPSSFGRARRMSYWLAANG